MTGVHSKSIRWDIYARLAVALILILSLVRFFIAGWFELSGDEAYYWLWSQRLDWSYFSKGPGIAVTIALGTKIFGSTAFGVRWISVILSAGTGLLLFRLAEAMFSSRVAFWTVVAAALVPLFSAGGFIMTIDPLSVFFWALAAWWFWEGLESPRLLSWVPAGLAVGVGMLCKYTNAFELLGFAIFLVWSKKHRGRQLFKPSDSLVTWKNRGELFRGRFWLMVLVALLCLWPVIIWNAQHGWVTIEHLLHRGGLDHHPEFTPKNVLDFIEGQFAIFNPFLAFAWLVTVVYVWKQNGEKEKFLLSLSLPILLFYFALSFNSSIQLNWTALAFVTALPFLVEYWLKWTDHSKVWLYSARGALGLSAVVLILGHAVLFFDLPVIYSAISVGPIRSIEKAFKLESTMPYDPIRRIKGWSDLAVQVKQLEKKHGASFVICNKYTFASLIAFYHPDRPHVYVPITEGKSNQFSYWPDYYQEGFERETALFVSDTPDVPAELQREFVSVEPLGSIFSRSGGKPMYEFFIFLLRDYHPNNTPQQP